MAGGHRIVEALVTGPRGTVTGRFVLDTGASATTMTHERAELIGYSPRDGFRRTKVHTAIGAEEGYDDIDGLLGMNFLSDFNYEIRSSERRILVEKDRPMMV